jgi:toxin ParE1/3/4
MNTVWHPLAEDELNEVATFYHRRDERELAAKFLDEAERVTKLIAEAPAAGRQLRGGVRCWRLRTFPYSIIYRDQGDHIRILALAGDKQRPFYWSERA